MSSAIGGEPDKGSTSPPSGTDGTDGTRVVRTDTSKTRAATAPIVSTASNRPSPTTVTTGTKRTTEDRKQVVAEQKDRYGGFKWGSAFFGWLTATGSAVIMIALLAAAGTVAGMPTHGNLAHRLGNEASSGSQTAQAIGTVGAIAFLLILFVSYVAGGYVAGRMARFNGLKQGLAVWLWALLIAVVVAVLGVIAGDKYDVTDQLKNFPKIPVTSGDLTTGGLVALAAIAVTSLVGALLGGLAGMRFHRKVDKAGYAVTD